MPLSSGPGNWPEARYKCEDCNKIVEKPDRIVFGGEGAGEYHDDCPGSGKLKRI